MLSPFLAQALLILLSILGASTTKHHHIEPVRFISTPVKDHYIIQYQDGVDHLTRRNHQSEAHADSRKYAGGRYRGVVKSYSFGRFAALHVELDDTHVKKLNDSGLVSQHHLSLDS